MQTPGHAIAGLGGEAGLRYRVTRNAMPAPPSIEPATTRWTLPGAVAATAIAALVFAGWTGPGQESAWPRLLVVLADSLPFTAMWLGAAAGYGRLWLRLLSEDPRERIWLQASLGVASLLWLDESLGAIGLFGAGRPIGAWLTLAIGWALLLDQVRRAESIWRFPEIPWFAGVSAIAVAVLLVAAASAPSWLWASEFGGYDALSYHLELPKEWLAGGRIRPLTHNVYSVLPGFMEAAYFHLACLRGDAIASACSCQLLHAAITLLTAGTLTAATNRRLGKPNGPIAACLLLGTPWVVVVGSLAYNEMTVCLFLAAGSLVLARPGSMDRSAATILGVLSGAACGAKLTAAGLVAMPLGVLMLMRSPARGWLKLGGFMLIGWVAAMLPWWVRNASACGNPVFPFATTLFGTAHWTAQQAATFAHGHRSSAGFVSRLAALWNEFFRYGFGSPPDPEASWRPQWLVLPWLGVAGLLAAGTQRRLRGLSLELTIMLLIQIAFWIGATHLKSRFLLPAAVPLAMACAAGFSAISQPNRVQGAASRFVLPILLLAWCAGPAWIFQFEREGEPAAAIGQARSLAGIGLKPDDAQALAETLPAVYINLKLPPNAKVLSLGDATPFYFQRPVVYQTTWDRGLLSALIRDHPDDPDSWLKGIVQAGFTHVLIDRTMLSLWEHEGWNDPAISSAKIEALAGVLTPEHAFGHGVMLYRVTTR